MNIIGISGSPTGGSSTDIIIDAVLGGIAKDRVKKRLIRLNEKSILPCQACGKSPEPDFCFFHDGMDELYNLLSKSEGIILGSPLYFDSVSAQTKLFIDRTNCLRPVDFSNPGEPKIKKPLFKNKKGGIVLVGGKEGYFSGALRTARGFFKWAGMDIVFELIFRSNSFNIGEAKNDKKILAEAEECGDKLYEAIVSKK